MTSRTFLTVVPRSSLVRVRGSACRSPAPSWLPGANVAICARDPGALARARDDLASTSGTRGRVVALEADVSREADVQRLIDSAIDAFGRIHVLVNNAGVYGPMGSIDEVDWAEWVQAIEINIYGSVLPIRAILPHFRKHGTAR